MSKTTKNLPVSILGRLRKKAQAEGRNAQDLLRYYAIERFLYRLSQSQHTDRFVLKGALIFLAWGFDSPRPTRDIDLYGFVDSDIETMCNMVRDICLTPASSDGMSYDADSIIGEVVREGASYQGVRIKFKSNLGKSRVPMQIDVGVADTITPAAQSILYPTLLEHPAPELRGYPPETVVAEKLEAMVVLGEINSRMKDFYDIWLISQLFEFQGPVLQEAVHATFFQRRTNLPDNLPIALTDEFAIQKQGQWQTFISRSQLDAETLQDFQMIIEQLRAFLIPLLQSEKPVGQWSGTQTWQ